MSERTAAWVDALDTIEASLDAVDAQLGDDSEMPEPVAWAPPEHLGQLPLPLAGRATELAQRVSDTQEKVTARRRELKLRLGELDRRRGAGHAYAAAGPTDPPADA